MPYIQPRLPTSLRRPAGVHSPRSTAGAGGRHRLRGHGGAGDVIGVVDGGAGRQDVDDHGRVGAVLGQHAGGVELAAGGDVGGGHVVGVHGDGDDAVGGVGHFDAGGDGPRRG